MKVRNIALPLILTVAAGAGVVKSCGNKTVQPERIEAAANNTNPLSDSAKTLAIFFPFFPFFTKKGTKKSEEEIQGTEKSEVTIQSTQIVDLNEEELRKLYEKVINEAGQYENINIKQVLHCIRIEPEEHKLPSPPPKFKKSDNSDVEFIRRATEEMYEMAVLAHGITAYMGRAVEENKAGNRPYALQAAAAILDNQILMKNRNLQIFFPGIYGALESHGISAYGHGKKNSQCYVDFIYDLTSKKNAPILANKDVQNGLGVMLMGLAQFSDSGREEKYYGNLTKFLEFLRNNPEYISHPSLRSYITYAGRDYEECVKQMKDGFVFNVPFKEPQ